jgi:hypothetical protein
MSPILAGLLMVISVVSAIAVAITAPVVIAVVVREIVMTEESAVVDAPPPSTVSIAMKRGGARAFVLAGGAFWSAASFAGLYSFRQSGAGSALLAALYPLAACAVTLVVGWYYERVTSVLLTIGASAVVVWGVLYQFEIGVWVLMTLALIGPMLTAALLFWLARGDQDVFEMHYAASPVLHPIFSARSALVPARVAA